MPYDDQRYYTIQSMSLADTSDAIGTAAAARAVLHRKTMLKAITVKDWNVEALVGATCTGTGGVTTEVYQLAIGKSTGGTGSVTTYGTAYVGGTAGAYGSGGAADNSVVDASLTEFNLAAGDDIIFSAEVGTALGDNSLVARANVSYVETFTGG